MSKIEIEHIKPSGDVWRIQRILSELDSVLIPTLSSRVSIGEYAKKLADKADLFYACCDGTDIGNCAIYLNSKEQGYISSIAVKKEWQGQGVGHLLWKQVLVTAREKRVRYIDLQVYRSNAPARKFYQKIGFKALEEKDDWIHMRYEIEKRK